MTYLTAILIALAVGWCWGHLTTRVRVLFIPTGPPAPLDDGVVAVALAAACCETWWASAGAEHDSSCERQTPKSSAA